MSGVLAEEIPAPTLAPFGLPTPDGLVSLAMSYQIAQKIHAATDPHDPPEFVNERARDVVDLLLLHELALDTGSPADAEVYTAVLDIFASRAREAELLGRPPKVWPARLTALPHWHDDYDVAAASGGIELSLAEAVRSINEWLDDLDAQSKSEL